MKETSWKWVNSKQKRAAQIMWETQGQDFDHVIARIMEDCEVTNLGARALYRKLAREELIDQGFVPSAPKMGRPRKDSSAPKATYTRKAAAAPVAHTEPVAVEPEPEEIEPEPERTETGERKSIADMKAYLEQLKRKAG